MYETNEIGSFINNWKMAGEFDEFGNPILSNFIDGEHYPELSDFNDVWWTDKWTKNTTHYCSEVS